MPDARIQSFEEFWPFYLSQHSVAACRILHFFGSTLAMATIATAIATREPLVAPFALVAGYGPAWIGHFFIEKNKPATFEAPLWSLISDYRMCGLWLSGRLGHELMKYQIRS